MSSHAICRQTILLLYHGYIWNTSYIASVQFSRSVVSDFLPPHESQHAQPPCLSPTPGVHSNSCPSSRWCHPVISSSVVPSPPAPNPSQHQGLFQWVNSSHEEPAGLPSMQSHRDRHDWSDLAAAAAAGHLVSLGLSFLTCKMGSYVMPWLVMVM